MAEDVKRGAGRPRKDTPTPVEYPPLTLEEIATTVAPTNTKGQPDLGNYMPFRLIPHAEAVARGWTYFYDARQCKRGHQAPHFTKNVHHCIDCKRTMEDGKQPIGGRAGGTAPEKPRQYVQKAVVPAGTTAVSPRPPECDRLEKQFLTAYAETKDFNLAADKCNVSAPHMQARMSYSPLFRDAIADLEDRLSIVHVPAGDAVFEWNEDKVQRLLMVFVDTGEIATARDSIGVTPSQFHKELRDNYDFATRYAEADKLAAQVLKEKATQLALRGNDKLLQQLLKAEMPDKFGDKLNLNMSGEVRSTDDQLRDEVIRLVLAGRKRITGRTIDAESVRAIEAPADVGGEEPASGEESISDLL